MRKYSTGVKLVTLRTGNTVLYYEDVSKSSRTVPVKRSLLTLEGKFLHHLHSTSLLHEYSGPSVSAMLGKHPWKSLFGIVSSTLYDSSWISSMVSNLRPFIRSFSLGKRKKSQGARSYGGWGTTVMLFLAKNCETLKDLWAGALSWWIMSFWFCHFCGLLRRTFSRNLLRTSQ